MTSYESNDLYTIGENNLSEDETDIEDEEEEYLYLVEPNVTYLHENLDNLPNDLKIFSMPFTTAIACDIHIHNIFNYYPLNTKNIISIKVDSRIRSLYPCKTKAKSGEVINFYNQITIQMVINNDEKDNGTKIVNIKIFGNNSIQVTGLKSIYQCNHTISKLIRLLRGTYGFIVDKDDETKIKNFTDSNIKFKRVKFIEDDIIYIKPLKISTINTMFQYSAKINQVQCYYKIQELKLKKIISDKVIVFLQTEIVSPVTIWLPFDDIKIFTIFIFESGIVSIMSCTTREHVLFAYNFIFNLLSEYNDFIVKKDLLEIIANDSNLKQYIDIEALAKVSKLL